MTPAVAMRRWLVHAALAVSLMGSQAMAVSHALSHALSHADEAAHAAPQDDRATPHCTDCTGLISFGAVLPAQGVEPLHHVVLAHIATAAPIPAAVRAAALPPYRSRAPPPPG